jgi:hypothetical protein
LFRIAEASGEWDIDKLEESIPMCMVVEWNEYLNWKIEQIVTAILSALPAAKTISDSNEINVIKDPKKKMAVLDMIGKISNG